MGVDYPLRDLMQKFTYREWRMRIAWLAEEHNSPDRTDHYLMQLTGIVDHLMSSSSDWELDRYKIQFRTGPPTQEEIAEKAAAAKRAWNRRFGVSDGD